MLDALNRKLDTAYHNAEILAAPRAKAAPTGASLLGSGYTPGHSTAGDTTPITAAKAMYSHYKGRVFSAIRVIAERMSGQPVIVARVGKPKNSKRSLEHYVAKGAIRRQHVPPHLKRYTFDEVEILPDHKLLSVLADPNELMLESTLWLVSVANICVTGRCLWIVDPDPARPEIVPIPTTWATPVHDKKNGKLYVKWKIRPPNSTETLEVDGQFVANFFIPDPEDPFGCTSMLAMQGDAVLADESIATAQRVAFANEINPATAVVVGDAVTQDGKRQIRLDPAQRKQLIAWLRQEYAGARKHGLPIILDSMIKDIKSLGSKPKEIGFMESAEQTLKQIFMGFGVPLSSAGVTEGTNYASSAVADHTFVQNCVNPLCKLFSEGITAWVLPLFDKSTKTRAWIIPAEAYDPDLQIRRYLAGRQSFSIKRNEFRTELLGLPAIDGMDDMVVPAGMMSVSAGEPVVPVLGTNTPSPTNGQSGPDAADNEDMRQDRDDQKSFTTSVKSLWLKVQGAEERILLDAMNRYFAGQVKSVVVGLRALGDSHREIADASAFASQLVNVNEWTEKLRETLKPVLRKQMQAGAALNLASTERAHRKVLMQVAPEIQQAIQVAIDDSLSRLIDMGLWRDVNETTKRDLSFVIQESMTEGDTLREMADRIEREMGPEWSGVRALKVARTESGAALNAGHYATQEQLESEGLAVGQQWLSILDEDTRPDHVEMNEVTVAAGEPFIVGGHPCKYPGDPELPAAQRVHCRCVSIPVLEPFEASYGGRLKTYRKNGHATNGKCR